MSVCVAFSSCELIGLDINPNNGNNSDNGGDNSGDNSGDNNGGNENETPEYDVEFYFNDIDVTTTEDGATIKTVRPYMTVDGETLPSAEIYLEYNTSDSEDTTVVDDFVASSGNIITFELADLSPSTLYQAYLYVDGGSDYGRKYKYFAFKTTENHSYAISCHSSVEAAGLKAVVHLSDVKYLVDDEPVTIASVRLEYSRAESNKWIAIDVEGKAFNDNEESITLPAKGEEYLLENTAYRYRVTITPKDKSYEAMTTEVRSFETTIAEIKVGLSTPKVSLDDEALHVEIESINITCDGIYYPDYPHCGYYVCIQKVGASSWDAYKATRTSDGMNVDIPVTELTQGTTYLVAGVLVVGIEQEQYSSDIVQIAIPKSEKPTPKPPVGGDADTTAIAGEWKLTEWREEVPTFDVYLSISEDGVVGLWQRLTSRQWELYYSTVAYEDNIIYGEYTDGISWGAAYYVTISGDKMTWTDTTDSSDVSVYTRTTLPDDIATTRMFNTTELSPRFL